MDGKAREIWRLENTMPHIPSPLLSGNRLYLWADNGVITCVRPKTGEQVWKARVEGVKDTFFGSPVRAGNTIFCVSAFGKVVAIADGDEFKQLGVTDLNQGGLVTRMIFATDPTLISKRRWELTQGVRKLTLIWAIFI